MPRTVPPGRLSEIATVATQVFGRVGYRRTRMADVAAAAGISAGGLFNYVETKEALFHLVFAHGFGELDPSEVALPYPAPSFGETVALIERGLRRSFPVTVRVRKTDEPGDVEAELRELIEQRYRAITRVWPLIAVIERCAVDLPELETLYFQRGRRSYIGQLTRYLERGAKRGELRPMSDPTVVARMITESIVWFAWHRREDRDANAYDDDAVLRTIVTMYSDALVARS
jgi:AcrR family transcriptional regulator